MRDDHKKRTARVGPGGCVETRQHDKRANFITALVENPTEISSPYVACDICGEPVAQLSDDALLNLCMACRIERQLQARQGDPYGRLVAELAARIEDLLLLCRPDHREEDEAEFACEVSSWLYDVRRRILRGG